MQRDEIPRSPAVGRGFFPFFKTERPGFHQLSSTFWPRAPSSSRRNALNHLGNAVVVKRCHSKINGGFADYLRRGPFKRQLRILDDIIINS